MRNRYVFNAITCKCPTSEYAEKAHNGSSRRVPAPAASSDPGIPEPNKRHSGQTRRAATIFRKNWSKSLSCCFGLPIGRWLHRLVFNSADGCHRSVNSLPMDAISSPLAP